MKHLFTCIFSKKLRQAYLFLLGCLMANALWGQCPAPNPSLASIDSTWITDSTAAVNWFEGTVADSFFIEYGPTGFPPGSGMFVTAYSAPDTLEGLNPCVEYDVYVYAVCEDEMSDPTGPMSFTTTSGDVCTYTFDLNDSFGDGWNGSYISVLYNGEELTYTIENGTDATFELEAYSSVPMCIGYSPGIFENEVTFTISDSDGNVIYSDGPNPVVGEDLFTEIACGASCPAPKVWNMGDINATNATTQWEILEGYDGAVTLEYGPMGFTRGTGTSATIPAGQTSFMMTGLEEKTWYNIYLGVDCGGDSSKVIGPLVFETLWLVDVGVTSISPNADDFCNLGNNEIITVGLTNFGQLPQTLFEFYFSVNGVAASIPVPQDGLFTGVVGNDSTQLIEFETMWDFSQPGLYVIEAWTEAEDDGDILNDTFRVEFLNSFPKPISEDFEDSAIPADWAATPFPQFYPPFAHNNETFVLGANLYSGFPEMSLTTGRIGPVTDEDTLSFDYRFVNYFAGTDSTILQNDSLIVQISDDCEESFETVMVIDSTNHVPTTQMTNVEYPLGDHNGKTIHVRFIGKWEPNNGNSVHDYWLDLDNINIQGTCPASFGSIVELQGTFDMESTGSANITPVAGTGPYTFEWSDGTTSEGDSGSLEDLPIGSYSVEITDANDCTETVVFEIGMLVAADENYGVEAISLYPNPTTGLVNLNIDLTNAMDIQARTMDLSGRIIVESMHSNVLSLSEQLDLSNQPSGLYIIQVIANGKPYYAKVMVSK